MAAKKSRRKLKGCFVISPIADDSTPERAEIRRRALYLEKLIAKAMKTLGFDAKLIINDPSKEFHSSHDQAIGFGRDRGGCPRWC